jgi:protein-tyrosine-phosphatase
MKYVLFVDVRNATRSQIAEAWFNHLANGWGQARSCGTMPAAKVDDRAVRVMREVGLDIRRQVPKAVSQQMLSHADIVVMMGDDIYPRAFAPGRIWDFSDPDGQRLEEVRALRDAIRQRVRALIVEIRQENFEPNDTEWQITALLHNQMLPRSWQPA